MSKRTCSVCDKMHHACGFCHRHYRAWKKYGDPFHETRISPEDFKVCAAKGCVNTKHHAGGFCNKHYRAWKKHGDPLVGCYPEIPSYDAVHYRIGQKPRKAKEYPCIDCGTPAAHWSYKGESEREAVEERNGRMIAYSPDPDDYQPRCYGCHVAYDQRRSSFGKLTDETVIEARKLRKVGIAVDDLAARYGVSKTTMYYAVTGQAWKHLNGVEEPCSSRKRKVA